jgi:hypothetical protein
MQDDPITKSLITSAKTLFPNKLTFRDLVSLKDRAQFDSVQPSIFRMGMYSCHRTQDMYTLDSSRSDLTCEALLLGPDITVRSEKEII